MNGIERIAAERKRQIEVEGFSAEHDDKHDEADLSDAAQEYCEAARMTACGLKPDKRPSGQWPWHDKWWKPSTDPIRNLEKAGALIAAEIDRILRARGEQ